MKRSTTTKKAVTKTAAKKAPAKAVAKKVAAKRAPTKRPKQVAPKVHAATERPLVVARGEHCFWMTDGQVLRDLVELAAAFGSMDETVFLYHAGGDKNDFADWVELVLFDSDCASDLRRCKKPTSARVVVRRHIRTYR